MAGHICQHALDTRVHKLQSGRGGCPRKDPGARRRLEPAALIFGSVDQRNCAPLQRGTLSTLPMFNGRGCRPCAARGQRNTVLNPTRPSRERLIHATPCARIPTIRTNSLPSPSKLSMPTTRAYCCLEQ